MFELIPNWKIEGIDYPEHSFYYVDRRKIKKLKRKNHIVELDSKYDYLSQSMVYKKPSIYLELNECIHNLSGRIILEKNKPYVAEWLYLYDNDEYQSGLNIQKNRIYMWFNTKQEYLKWKLQL